MDKELKFREKKRIIMQALRRCLERDVYSKITIQAVAKEAGFSKGGLLHYFASKEDMFLELVEDMCSDIITGQKKVLEGIPGSNEKASLSALYGIEKFFLDSANIHVFLNLLLYSFENPEIKESVKRFFSQNKELYQKLIEDKYAGIPRRRRSDTDPDVQSRIVQILVLSAGILEAVDPVDLDHYQLTKFILAMLKN